ncbi:(2Fe-2S)-binding protein (plasmid) [Rhodococcus qingshengii]|uniref:aromatic ring-hydroxylating oxygenase subunit alpha n=1 Tax=Rhodococcus qingshengii TaxID=334542 RepID=UPI0007E555C3|nr:aromatic ring-hydroxylating dioxygenase subunit alpha [Rhodococcus qingshengii]BCF86356.1 (2Fe-2S)-binding protein [Rhodococcus qingshengii]
MHTVTAPGQAQFTLTPERGEELGEGPVAVDTCTSQEYFEKEREQVFRKSWLCMGRVEEVPEVGDFIVKELTLFKTSLLISRGRDGVVRGFHNVCSHRCNKLVMEDEGTARSFVCRFHGWTYQTDGSLKFVPQEEIFPPIDHAKNGLTPVDTDVWRGFIFVKMDKNSGVGLQEFMAPFTEPLAAYPFEEYVNCHRYETVVNCNWKLILDAFLESYHLRFLHKNTVAEIFRNSKEETAADAYGFELYKRHGRMTVPGVAESRSHPVEDLVMMTAMSFFDNKETATAAPPGLNPAGGENWAFDLMYVFPNTLWLMNAGSTYAALEVLPLGPNQTLWTSRTYSPPAKDGLERFAQEYNRVLARDTLAEDASTLEVTQAVLESGAKTEMILGDQELMLRHLHDVVDQVVNGEEASIA